MMNCVLPLNYSEVDTASFRRGYRGRMCRRDCRGRNRARSRQFSACYHGLGIDGMMTTGGPYPSTEAKKSVEKSDDELESHYGDGTERKFFDHISLLVLFFVSMDHLQKFIGLYARREDDCAIGMTLRGGEPASGGIPCIINIDNCYTLLDFVINYLSNEI